MSELKGSLKPVSLSADDEEGDLQRRKITNLAEMCARLNASLDSAIARIASLEATVSMTSTDMTTVKLLCPDDDPPIAEDTPADLAIEPLSNMRTHGERARYTSEFSDVVITYCHQPHKPTTPDHKYQLPAKDRRRPVRTDRKLKPHSLPSEESTPVPTSNHFAMLDDDSSTTTLMVVQKLHRLNKVYIGSFVHTPQRRMYENTWRLGLYQTGATLLISVSTSPKRGTTQSQCRSASVWRPLLLTKLCSI